MDSLLPESVILRSNFVIIFKNARIRWMNFLTRKNADGNFKISQRIDMR